MSDEKAQWEVGDHLEAMWEDGNYYRSEVTEVLQGGKYEVMFVEYSEKATVTFEQMRPLQGLLPFTSSTPSAASHPSSSSTSNPFPFASAVANAHTQARTASMDFDYTLKGLRKKPVTEGAPFGNLSLTRGFDKASHLEPVIDRQCKGGLRLMREMAQYLQKLGHLQMSFADSFQKLNQIEHTKRDELRQEDGMPGYVDAYFLLQNAFTDSGLSHRKFATMIQSDIAEYLLRTATEQEKILKASALEEQKANTLLQQRLQAMQSAYKAANVAWKNLCAQQKSRNTAKIPAAQRAAHEKFLRLEESRSAYFAEQTNYAAKLATHLRNLEGIESARMQALQAALTKFKEHEEKCLNQQEILKVFVDYISQITTAQDAIDSLVGKWLNIYGAFPRYVVPACELPCSASMLADGESKWVELAQEEVLLPLPIPSSSSSSAMPSVESLSPIAASASSPTSSSSSSSAAFLSTPATAEERKRQPSMRNLIRVAVSKKKIRYNKKGFDLDLTYVLDNLISMGFPAEGLQGQYRNPLTEVQRFFNQEHPKNYKVYNLCSELSYDPKKFEDRVARYAFDDHCPPPLELMDPFCRDVHQWLTESPTHVAAVHCKAGKGRTGLMCSCYLLFCGLASTPEAALRHFAVKRTANAKGVTIPSQMRYVWYYSRILAQETLPVYQPLVVKQIVIHGVPWDVKSAEALALNLQTQERKEDGVILKDIFSSKSTGVLGVWSSPFDCLIYAAENESSGLCVVSGDVCLKISGAAKCRLWFNTRFVKLDENGEGRAVFHKSEIDSALKDVNHDIFPEHFQVVFNVRAVGPPSE